MVKHDKEMFAKGVKMKRLHFDCDDGAIKVSHKENPQHPQNSMMVKFRKNRQNGSICPCPHISSPVLTFKKFALVSLVLVCVIHFLFTKKVFKYIFNDPL